jgi:hypothetical protein
MNCVDSAPSPPSLMVEGNSPAAMLRKKATASSGPYTASVPAGSAR